MRMTSKESALLVACCVWFVFVERVYGRLLAVDEIGCE